MTRIQVRISISDVIDTMTELELQIHDRNGLRSRILTIIAVGITIGFLLGMSVVALLRALLGGDSAELEISFTALTGLMTALLVTYVIRTTH